MTSVKMDLRPEPKRDRWGRYLIEGTAYTRATTIAGTLDDTYNLGRWQQRMVAKGLTLRDDLFAQAAALDPSHDKKEFNGVCKDALEAAKASRGANLGNALHKFMEDVDLGIKTLDEVPEPYRTIVASYHKLLDDNNVTLDRTVVEQIVAHTGNNIAGTIDRVAFLQSSVGLPKVVADIKTGETLDWSWLYISIQLAIYATHTNTYDAGADKLGPAISDLSHEQGLVIHVPSNGDTPALYLVDLKQGFDAMLCALEARGHRKDLKDAGEPYGTTVVEAAVRRLDDAGMLPGIPEQREWLKNRMVLLPPAAVVDLRNRWPDNLPQPFPEIPTLDQIEQLHEVLTRVEAIHELPFGDARPGAKPIRRPGKPPDNEPQREDHPSL